MGTQELRLLFLTCCQGLLPSLGIPWAIFPVPSLLAAALPALLLFQDPKSQKLTASLPPASLIIFSPHSCCPQLNSVIPMTLCFPLPLFPGFLLADGCTAGSSSPSFCWEQLWAC